MHCGIQTRSRPTTAVGWLSLLLMLAWMRPAAAQVRTDVPEPPPGLFSLRPEPVRILPLSFSLLPFLSLNRNMQGYPVNYFSINATAEVAGSLAGMEISGVGSVREGEVRGLQVAGLCNIVGNRIDGLQIAGGLNYVHGELRGMQISGLLNFAGSLRGMQLGLINISRGEVKGFQLGLVNVASASSFSLGLVNVIPGGHNGLGLVLNSTGSLDVEFRNGGRYWHTFVSLGQERREGVGEAGRTLIGLGFGLNFPASGGVVWNLDAFHRQKYFHDDTFMGSTLRLSVDFPMVQHLFLNIGVGLTVFVYDGNLPAPDSLFGGWMPRDGLDRATRHEVRIIPAFSLGLSYVF